MNKIHKHILPGGVEFLSTGKIFTLSYGDDDKANIVFVSKQDIEEMYKIAFPDREIKKKRYEQYQTDPILTGFKYQLENVLTWSASPGVKYPDDLSSQIIPYDEAQKMIDKLLAAQREYVKIYYSDIINLEHETT